ncbi:hypothetical protein M1O50_02410 [Dehalococcoidia bacterium]|nr:hypothetical protein [Dehalococcoidia bacterium]
MRNLKRLTCVLLVVVLSTVLAISAVFAATDTAPLDVAVTEGLLVIVAPAATLEVIPAARLLPTTTTGWIGNATHTDLIGVNVRDERGTGAGWSTTITSTHFTHRAPYKLLAGANDTVTFSGTYDGLLGVSDPPATFVVEIELGGAVGTATFKWWTVVNGLAEPATSGVLTASTVALGNGISVNFAAATYAVGDKWSAAVDVFPYTGLTVTPSIIHVESGVITGVAVGAGGTFAGAAAAATSDALSLMIAEVNRGLGSYWQDEHLTLVVHPNSLSGVFTATATLTVL